MPSYAVTGASRGIGYEFILQLSKDPSNVVIGLVRNEAATNEKTRHLNRSNLHIIQADLVDYESLKASVEKVAQLTNGSLDYLIANAGYISNYSAYDTLSGLGDQPKKLEEDLLQCFQVNAIGNIHLFNLFMPLVLRGQAKKVVTLSSGFADEDLTSKLEISVAGPYSISKAAVNMVVAKYSAEYAKEGVLFLALAPGAVETGQDNDRQWNEGQAQRAQQMGEAFMKYAPSFRGRTTTETSVKLMLRTIDFASVEGGYGGAFISQYGNKQWL